MALCDDLLAQARALAVADPGVPTQANLRRAISSAYYALFHLLIAEALALLVPGEPKGLRERAGRAFSHGEMKQVCWRFQSRNLPKDLSSLIPGSISSDLSLVASTFVVLQEQRHKADYDLASHYGRAFVLRHVDDAEAAFAAWRTLRSTEEATVFLTALAFAARWSK